MADEEGNLQIFIGAPVPGEFRPRSTYANVTSITFTPWDFKLTFSLLETPFEAPSADDSHVVRPTIVSEVTIPAGAVPALVEILQAQLNNHSQQFGNPSQEAPEAP